ncbi:MAG: heme ABC transporter ATP-binding protein [Pseudomonadota bacterium]
MTIRADNVTIARGGSAIVRNTSASVEVGKMTAIVGPNGAGKSTLLRALAGELKASEGQISLGDQPIDALSVLELARHRAVMAQSTPVVFDFTVDEILGLGWIESQYRTTEQNRIARQEIVAECAIQPLLSRTFRTLSGGEQQRVQFARCLLQIWQPQNRAEARYLLLDEPTSSLDVSYELTLLRLAKARARSTTGVLLVLHDLNLAARFCDEVILMSDGRVVDSGHPQTVFGDDLLSDIYSTAISVEWHDALERLVIHT